MTRDKRGRVYFIVFCFKGTQSFQHLGSEGGHIWRRIPVSRALAVLFSTEFVSKCDRIPDNCRIQRGCPVRGRPARSASPKFGHCYHSSLSLLATSGAHSCSRITHDSLGMRRYNNNNIGRASGYSNNILDRLPLLSLSRREGISPVS